MKYLIILLFISCVKQNLSQQECQELAYKAYKGFPNETKQFKANCLDYDLKHTVQSCQKALEKMVVGHNEFSLNKQFGQGIMNCFSQNDIKKFLKN